MDSCAAPSNCGLHRGHHKNSSRASQNPQIFSISRTIPLDMFAKLSTIRAQSGKKWRRVVELGSECRAVGPWKQSAIPAASSGELRFKHFFISEHDSRGEPASDFNDAHAGQAVRGLSCCGATI